MGTRVLALLAGDMSGSLIHPALVHVAHLSGFAIWQERHACFSLGTEEYLRQVAEDALASLELEGDHADNFCPRIHMYTTLAGYHLQGRRIEPYQSYLHLATDLINRVDVTTMFDEFLAAGYPTSRTDTGPHVQAVSPLEGIVDHDSGD
jgi:hypothetical protein